MNLKRKLNLQIQPRALFRATLLPERELPYIEAYIYLWSEKAQLNSIPLLTNS